MRRSGNPISRSAGPSKTSRGEWIPKAVKRSEPERPNWEEEGSARRPQEDSAIGGEVGAQGGGARQGRRRLCAAREGDSWLPGVRLLQVRAAGVPSPACSGSALAALSSGGASFGSSWYGVLQFPVRAAISFRLVLIAVQIPNGRHFSSISVGSYYAASLLHESEQDAFVGVYTGRRIGLLDEQKFVKIMKVGTMYPNQATANQRKIKKTKFVGFMVWGIISSLRIGQFVRISYYFHGLDQSSVCASYILVEEFNAPLLK
jgi:hypothetical protein